MIYVAMGVQFFEGPDEWAKGNAVWAKENTEALAHQAALVNMGGLDSLTSWFGAFEVNEEGSLELVAAWHLGADGVQEGLPDTSDMPMPLPDNGDGDATPPDDEGATPPSDEGATPGDGDTTPDPGEGATPGDGGGDPDPDPTYDAWVEWSGNNEDLHQIGDIVTHNGQLWISTQADNHWEPGVFGWEVYNP